MQSQRDTGVLWAQEQITISVGWPWTKLEDRFLELRSAQQIVQTMTGPSPTKRKAISYPHSQWHIDELANAVVTAVTHPLSLLHGWNLISLYQRHLR